MNSELENLIKQGARYADIGFENCECMVIPIEDIIDFNSSNDGIKCVIKESNKIQYDEFNLTKLSPLQRILKHNDITSFQFRDCKTNLIKDIEVLWYDPEPDNPYVSPNFNEYQKSTLINKNELVLSINKENLKLNTQRFNLKDILEMNQEMIIIDENNNTYKVDKKDNKAFINNMTLDMLENTYTIVKAY